MDANIDCGPGGRDHRIPQDMSEHELNTAALSSRGGLKPPAAGADLHDICRTMRWSNGCALRRGLELGEIDPRKVTLLGCRDYDWEEVEFIRKMGVTLIPAATAHRWTGTQLADEVGSRIGSDA